tara:strand:- start:208 stop:393 length:186 start_codon:yes stop_codon:yes gene_type:complete
MLLETHTGSFISVERTIIERLNRAALQQHLELRGYAVYDDEPTSLLRECALEDLDMESEEA